MNTREIFQFRGCVVIVLGFLSFLLIFQHLNKNETLIQEPSQPLQCEADLRTVVALLPLDRDNLDCEKSENYSCERRIFRPDIETSEYDIFQCPLQNNCLRVTTRLFDTSSAMQTDFSLEEFEDGGEYNREQVKCQHKTVYRGLALFEGEANTIEVAYAQALEACQRAKTPQLPNVK
ncbi:MAG: hypothetical protein AB7O96_01930 [Pseudobdellovibrionaceae bacterium]